MPIFCSFCGKQAYYGCAELSENNELIYKRTSCKKHCVKNEKYLNSKKCINDDCNIIPTLGFIKNKPISCLKHSEKEMKNVVTRKCNICYIKQPSFNLPLLVPKYCFDCKTDDMVNTKKKGSKREIIDISK
jgi:hypothetical protein